MCMKIAFLPIDDRPVCYSMPEIISEINNDIKFFIPPRNLLGNLKKIANTEKLFNWLKDLPEVDAVILSLDTLVYGGLIPSRRSSATIEELNLKLDEIKQILISKNARIYAFSSIMRISNNNFNEEEKDYWNLYGKKIFEYSYNFHKNGHAETDVPQEVLEDYLTTRKRNFEINKTYLQWEKEGIFNTLVFTKDDCAPFGLNVLEAQELENSGAYTTTGADEVPLSLMARALSESLKICPIFLEPEYKNLISNYEDISVEKSVAGQIKLAGCEISTYENADIVLIINNFKNKQGEIVMKQPTEMFSGSFDIPSDKKYMIADIRFANGADNNFVNELFKNELEDESFYGYSAWNTTANTLGSLLCTAKYKFFAQKYNRAAFQKLQLTRFLDDWAYQANVRQALGMPDVTQACKLMFEYEDRVKKFLKTDTDVIRYSFPWDRLFEVEVWI